MARETYVREVQQHRRKALAYARGYYQEGIILGDYNLSGSDLRGEARRWGRFYKKSVGNLLDRLDTAMSSGELLYAVALTTKGKQVLVWGPRAVWLAKHGPSLKRLSPRLYEQVARATETGYRYKALRQEAEVLLEMHQMANE